MLKVRIHPLLTLLKFVILPTISIPLTGQNVGIGEPSPTAKLHITVPPGFANPLLLVEEGASTRLILKPGGLVGINTPNPGVPLQIHGGSDATLSTGGFLQVGSNSSNIVIDDNEIMARNKINGTALNLHLNMDGGNVYMHYNLPGRQHSFLASGEVGIGTTLPARMLHVAGDMRLERLVPFSGITNSNDSILVRHASGDVIGIAFTGNTTDVLTGAGVWIPTSSIGDDDWYKTGTSSHPLSINDSIYTYGYVGIGTNSPRYKLHVVNEGSICAEGTINSGDTIHQGAKNAFIWLPRKASIRAGLVSNSQWDWTNIGYYSVAFGLNNTAKGNASTITGGSRNVALGYASGILTGSFNLATGSYTVVVGGYADTALGGLSFIGAGSNNKIYSSGGRSAIVAGYRNYIERSYGFIGSGVRNRVRGTYGAVVSGTENYIIAGNANFIGSGYGDTIIMGNYNVIVGGNGNKINHWYGRSSIVGGEQNEITGHWGFIGGGEQNVISGVHGATISGGRLNTVTGIYGTIPGGKSNTVSGNYSYAAGSYNSVSGNFSIVQGYANSVTSDSSVIAGGSWNTIGGQASIIIGGVRNNVQADYACAGGKYMHIGANGTNTFVWGHASSPVVVNTPNAFIIGPGGNTYRVGINLPNPTYALELPNNTNNSIGKARANAWDLYSDARVKSNVQDIRNAIDIVMSLRPVQYFHHNSYFSEDNRLVIDSSGQLSYGFIAQEMYTILPELVYKPQNEHEELWGIDYIRLIPILTAAIQEQQKIIEQLQKENEMLKQQVLDLMNLARKEQ